MSAVIDKAAKKGGEQALVQARAAMDADHVISRAMRSSTKEVRALNAAVTTESKGFLGWISSTMTALSLSAFGVPMLGKGLNWLSERKLLHNAKNALVVKGVEGARTFHKVTSVLDEEVHLIPEALKGAGLHKTSAMFGELGSKVSKFAKPILGEKLHGQFAQASGTNALFAGAGAVGETAGLINTVTKRVTTLEAMQTDLTGKVPSAWTIIFRPQKLHPLVQHARGEAVSFKAAAGMALQLGGAIANAYIMLRFNKLKNALVKSMGISMGTGMAASMITAGDTALVSYQELAKSFKHSGRAEVETYVGFIGGFAPNADVEQVQKLAEQAYKEQLKPKAVLELIDKSLGRELKAQPTPREVQGHFTGKLAATQHAKETSKPLAAKFTDRIAANDAQHALRA